MMFQDANFTLLETFDALNERKRQDPANLTKTEMDRWRIMRCQLEEALFQRPRDPRADTREHLRVPVSLQVRYQIGSRPEIRYASVLGEGGIGISTDNPAPRGTRLTLELTPLNFGSTVAVQAEVMWQSERAKPSERGMGLRFVDLTAEQHRAICTLVDDNLRQHLLERRHFARIDTRVDIRAEIGRCSQMLQTHDLSLGGLFIACESPPPVGEMVQFHLDFPGGVPAVGPSGWITHTASKLAIGRSTGFGVVFESLNLDDRLSLQNYIVQRVSGKIRHPGDEPRRHARLKRRIKVRFQAEQGFGTTDIRDIGGGGLFLQSREPPPVGSAIDVTLDHPFNLQSIRLAGRVVRIVPTSPLRSGMLPGAGVQFGDLGSMTEEVLLSFLKDLALAEMGRDTRRVPGG